MTRCEKCGGWRFSDRHERFCHVPKSDPFETPVKPKRRYSEREPHYYKAHGGLIEVACWCEQSTVIIRSSLVGKTTKSCGRPNCHEPVRAGVA